MTSDVLFLAGVKRGALRLIGANQTAQVAGPGHHYECFGDLSLCRKGERDVTSSFTNQKLFVVSCITRCVSDLILDNASA